MKNRKIFWGVNFILFLMLCSITPASAQTSTLPSSSMRGMLNLKEKISLAPSFIIAVNEYLNRYGPTLIEQKDDYIKMTAKHNYQINIELIVRQNEYEIITTVAQDDFVEKKARDICAKVVAYVNKSFI